MKDDQLIIVVNIFHCATQDELSFCCSIFFLFFFFSLSLSLCCGILQSRSFLFVVGNHCERTRLDWKFAVRLPFFLSAAQSYDSPRGNRRNRSRGEGRPYRKDGDTRQKL